MKWCKPHRASSGPHPRSHLGRCSIASRCSAIEADRDNLDPATGGHLPSHTWQSSPVSAKRGAPLAPSTASTSASETTQSRPRRRSANSLMMPKPQLIASARLEMERTMTDPHVLAAATRRLSGADLSHLTRIASSWPGRRRAACSSPGARLLHHACSTLRRFSFGTGAVGRLEPKMGGQRESVMPARRQEQRQHSAL